MKIDNEPLKKKPLKWDPSATYGFGIFSWALKFSIAKYLQNKTLMNVKVKAIKKLKKG